MAHAEIRYIRTIEDDATPLEQAVRDGLERPLILWCHPDVGPAPLLEATAAASGLPFRTIEPDQFESWEDYPDVSDSGHFRELSIEKFLARGERGDPETFTLESGAVLHLRDLNLTPNRLVQAVFKQVLHEGKLLNNPLPDDVRIIATCRPPDRPAAIELLGASLLRTWEACEERSSLRYTVFPLPGEVLKSCDHWALLPSLARFVAWGRKQGLPEEVLRFLEEAAERDADRANAMLHASVLHKADLFPQIASPRAFADLASLLGERKLYFSSRMVRDRLARAQTAEEFQRWLQAHVLTWDEDRWIEADSSLTVRGEPVTGSMWLRNMVDQIRRGEARLSLADLPTYAAYERRSLEMWSTQELGDEMGKEFVASTALSESDVARLGAG